MTGIGLIGCGNISGAYLTALQKFKNLRIIAIADRFPAAAEARAAEFGLKAVSVGALLADPEVEIVINLTIPKAHLEVGLQIIAAGKHLYSEKPLALSFADGKRLSDAADDAGVRLGCAPDTFLGGAHQTCRALVDEGEIGTPVGGTAFFLRPGHERWHPNPEFYYDIGGGPVLDMAPYYLTQFINLYGPVAEVAAFSSRLRTTRPAMFGPRKGEEMPVHIDTHSAGILAFQNGAIVQMGMSFDVEKHQHNPIEVYGTGGSILNPDPNYFGGQVRLCRAEADWEDVETRFPFHEDNFRSIGVADMARSLRTGQMHSANGTVALHVLEVMQAIQTASDERRVVPLATECTRPIPLSTTFKEEEYHA